MSEPYQIEVRVNSQFIAEQSDTQADRFVFSYHITIINKGTLSAQLLSRHWIITSSNQRVQEVKGDGVIGKQPVIKPGQFYEYTSFAIIDTPVGSMEGSYQMQAEDGHQFNAPIRPFTLALPHTLN